MLSGTFCRLSDRFSAVTMISSSPPVAAACCWACAAEITANTAEAIDRPFTARPDEGRAAPRVFLGCLAFIFMVPLSVS